MSETNMQSLKELRDAVNQSSEHTQRQLQNIQSNIFFGFLLSIVFALGISYLLKIMLYWIPASFLLMYLWALYSFISNGGKFNRKQLDTNIEKYHKLEGIKFEIGISYIFKNISPLINGVSLIYAITLLVLILIANGAIVPNKSFSLIIPSVVAFMYIPIPFFIDNLERYIRQNSFNQSLTQLFELKQKEEATQFKIFILAAILFFLFVYILIIIFLPLGALLKTYTIVEEILFLVLVLILQLSVIIMFGSYFSSLSAKRELSNTITNFADINYQINDAILSENITANEIERLKKMYLTAKQYELYIDSSLKFVHFYSLMMHRVYIKRK